MFKKILIIGSPGAGKSTFARRLSELTHLPLIYLDMIFHKEDRTTLSKEEFDEKLKEILTLKEYIIDGNYQRTLKIRIEASDCIFLLDIPLKDCLKGVNSRIGKARVDLPWIEEELDEEFKEQIINFPNVELPKIYNLLDKYKDKKKIYIFHSRKEIDDYLNKLFNNKII